MIHIVTIFIWQLQDRCFCVTTNKEWSTATKAAGQSRLSKVETVECNKIGHLFPYQLTLQAVYQLTLHGWYDENMDVLAKLMDYMPSKCNTLKSQYYSLYLTIVGLFDVYEVFSQWKSKQVVDYFTLGVQKVYFLFNYRVLSLPPTSRYFHRMCKTYLLMNGWQNFSGFTVIYTVRGPVSTNLAYQLTLPSLHLQFCIGTWRLSRDHLGQVTNLLFVVQVDAVLGTIPIFWVNFPRLLIPFNSLYCVGRSCGCRRETAPVTKFNPSPEWPP